MKKVILFMAVAAILAACGNGETKKTLVGKDVISRYTNGAVQIERDYKMIDGKRLAVYEWEYYEDGNILKEGPLSSNEKRDGEWKSYYRDGKLWSEGDYNDGVREGKTITYHPNGNKYYEGSFRRAQKTGIWKFYKENGEFDYEIDYDKRTKSKISIDTAQLKKKMSGN